MFQTYFDDKLRSFVVYFLIAVMLYQHALLVLITICDDTGFPVIFRNINENMYNEILHRILKYTLRVGTVVIMPIFFMIQLDTLAEKPIVPQFNLTLQETQNHVCRIHELFMQGNYTPKTSDSLGIFTKFENAIKHNLSSSIRTAMLHAVLLTTLLYWIGAFNIEEENIVEGGVCDYLHYDFNLPVVMEYVSIFTTALVVGIIKECYCYENRIAACVVLIEKKGEDLHDEIRKRWKTLDGYCYIAPLVLFTVAILSFSTGKTFIPKPTQGTETTDVISWYFWTLVLSVLIFFASYPNQSATYLIGYLASLVITFLGNGRMIPGTGDHAIFLMYIILTFLNFNLVSTLYRCNSNHYNINRARNRISYYKRLLCLAWMLLLFIFVIALAIREFIPFLHLL